MQETSDSNPGRSALSLFCVGTGVGDESGALTMEQPGREEVKVSERPRAAPGSQRRASAQEAGLLSVDASPTRGRT